mgnify:CR=1 FL=1
MLEIIKKNWDKNKIIAVFGIVIALLILIVIAYKNDDKETRKPKVFEAIDQSSDIINFKKFLLGQIRSPFININYDIVQGDTIQKILKKYKVKNNDIQTVINQYKKYGNSNQLLAGTIIERFNVLFCKAPKSCSPSRRNKGFRPLF